MLKRNRLVGINCATMLIRQSKNSFIRTTERYGYITNQLTRHDRTYDEDGALWLKVLSREPQEVDDIVVRLMDIYGDADFDTLKTDFMEFAESLATDKFVVIGTTAAELDAADEDFSYKIDNPKHLLQISARTHKRKLAKTRRISFWRKCRAVRLSQVCSSSCRAVATRGAYIAIFLTRRKTMDSTCRWQR